MLGFQGNSKVINAGATEIRTTSINDALGKKSYEKPYPLNE
jgi:hypothetical protein